MNCISIHPPSKKFIKKHLFQCRFCFFNKKSRFQVVSGQERSLSGINASVRLSWTGVICTNRGVHTWDALLSTHSRLQWGRLSGFGCSLELGDYPAARYWSLSSRPGTATLDWEVLSIQILLLHSQSEIISLIPLQEVEEGKSCVLWILFVQPRRDLFGLRTLFLSRFYSIRLKAVDIIKFELSLVV